LGQILRKLQEEYFGVVEAQVAETDPTGAAMLRSLGFEQVDVGRVYQKEV
jgi:hypothetical protein